MNQDPTRGAGVFFLALIGLLALGMILESCESSRRRSVPSTQPATTMATPELSSSGVPNDTAAILIGYFTDAQAAMAEVVRHPYGRTDAAKEYRAARAAAQGTQIDEILTRLRGQTSDWIGSDNTFAQSVHDGRARADRQAEDAGVHVEEALPARFDLIDYRTAAVFATDAARDLNKATNLMGDRSKGFLRATAQTDLSEADLNKMLAVGAIEGKPVETIRKLKEEFEKILGGNVININGRDYNVKAYADTVVRTKTRDAVETARHQRLEDLGIDLVAVIGRRSNNFCTGFLGQVFSLSGKSNKYPAYSSLPGGGAPFHPRCSKSTRPFIEELANDQQLEDAAIVPDAAKLLDKTPAQAQRAYKDLQLRQQIEKRYRDTEETVYGAADPGELQRQRKEARAKELEAEQAGAKTTVAVNRTAPTSAPTPAPARKVDQPTVIQPARQQAGEKLPPKPSEAKLNALQAKLVKARDERRAAEQRLAAKRAEIDALKIELGNALNTVRPKTAAIKALEKKIAAAEATARAYERAVRKSEAN